MSSPPAASSVAPVQKDWKNHIWRKDKLYKLLAPVNTGHMAGDHVVAYSDGAFPTSDVIPLHWAHP